MTRIFFHPIGSRIHKSIRDFLENKTDRLSNEKYGSAKRLVWSPVWTVVDNHLQISVSDSIWDLIKEMNNEERLFF